MNFTANGKYSIVAPGTLHSPGKYSVSVSIQDVVEPCQIRISINGPTCNESQLVDLEANQLEKIEFNIPKLVWQEGEYEIIAEGLKGLKFKHAAKLDFVNFLPYVMIQTNKHIYVPTEVLHFRVIFTDENFRPIEPEKNTIVKFEYSERAKYKEYKTYSVSNNIFCEKLVLPDLCGFWKLTVSVDEKICTAMNFNVDYKNANDVPRFIVKVEHDPHICIKDGLVPIVVKAYYNNKDPVNGKATLKLDDFTDDFNYGPVREMEMINGKATFHINFEGYEEHLSRIVSNFLHVTANVEENFTGIQVSGTEYGRLYGTHYTAICKDFQGGIARYRADEEFMLTVNINSMDGCSSKDLKSIVKLICEEKRELCDKQTEDPSEYKDMPKELTKEIYESHLNDAGIAVFQIKLKELTSHIRHYFEMTIIFKEEELCLGKMYCHYDEIIAAAEKTEKMPKEYFECKLENEKQIYKNGDDLIFSIKSSKPLTYFIYNIIGRGNLLRSERIELPKAVMEHNLIINSTFEMCPFGNIFIYYIDTGGTLHFAEQKFILQINLENKLRIFATEVVKPGDLVELCIETPASAFVGLFAIERKPDEYINYNDITYSIMYERLRNYFTQTLWQGSNSAYPGGLSGVLTLTNANYDHDLECVKNIKKYEVLAHEHAYADGDAQVNDTTKEFSFQLNTTNKVWIFDNIERTTSDIFFWEKRIPINALTTWHITGFALHPQKGLALLEKPVKIKTFKAYHVFVNLPYAMHEGEIIEVQVVAYNFLQRKIDILVTLNNANAEFDFLTPAHEPMTKRPLSKALIAEPNAVAITHFLLKPRKCGDILLEFNMRSSSGNKLLKKTLKVLQATKTAAATAAEKPQNMHKLSVEIKNAELPHKFKMKASFALFSKKYSFLEISLPAGYKMARPDLIRIEKNLIIQRNVELKNENTLIIAQVCQSSNYTARYSLPIWAYKSFNVMQQQPVTIVMYEEENPMHKSVIYYELPENTSNLNLH